MAGRRTTSNISFPDPSNSSHLYTPRTQYCLVYFIFQLRPPLLLIDLAWGAANSLVFAEHTLASFGSFPSPSRSIFFPVRLLAFVCLTGVLLLHGLHIPAGIRLQNMLGFMKIGILIVIGTGSIALTGNLREGSRVQEISIAGNKFGPDPRREAALSALAYTMYVCISLSNLVQL